MVDLLRAYAPIMKQEQKSILQEWLNDPYIKPVFEKYSINRKFFGTHFGLRVIDYFIGVASGDKAPGDCPVISVMLRFFEAKKIALPDIFRICNGLKGSLVVFMLTHKETNPATFKELLHFFGENFAGVIDEYIDLNYKNSSCHEEKMECSLTKVSTCHNVNICTTVLQQKMSVEEKENLHEIIDDINDYVGRFALHVPTEQKVEQFANKIRSHGYLLVTYGILDELSHHILHLADTISMHKSTFIVNLHTLLVLLECFGNDMERWRNSFCSNDNNIIDLQQSIIANISQIAIILDEGNGCDMEFF